MATGYIGSQRKARKRLYFIKENKEMDLENVTVEDCIELYTKKDTITVLNDGKIERFEKESK